MLQSPPMCHCASSLPQFWLSCCRIYFFFCISFTWPLLFQHITSLVHVSIQLNMQCAIKTGSSPLTCCLHLRSLSVIQWQLTIQPDELKTKLWVSFRLMCTVKRWKYIFFFLCFACSRGFTITHIHLAQLLAWISYQQQVLDQSQTGPMSLIAQTPVCLALCCKPQLLAH